MEKFRIFAIFLLFHIAEYACEDNPCLHTLSSTDIVDLTNLKGLQLVAYAAGNQTYVFSVCTDSSSLPITFAEAKNCTENGGFSLCMFNNTSPVNSTKLAKTMDWKWTEDSDRICLSADYMSLKLHIELTCISSSTAKKNDSFFVVAPTTDDQKDGIVTNFHLLSPLACPQKIPRSEGLSTGGVLMVILLVAFTMYFAIGIVVNFFMLGARGIEVIPNITFWRNLPGLVMDGIRFLQNGCKVRPSDLVQGRDTYDSI
ncbi:cation-dependent mannose-6-phosphate receptor-like [Lutzomyia longipalpis]|uniref:Putative mannose-6-phosphate receptor domain-containing protein n=1 Tax=Lutzomyia longipalpis TaxID=7200 RepID=A0A7G3AP86_LUTLO|nr:cation-dependent mannose-6-phosphate receptor-like [Lutzomyia longipalpis]